MKGNLGSRFLFGLLAILILSSAGYRYYEYIGNQAFILFAHVPCDSNSESCFVADCSPEEDPECDVTPYKAVEILAREAPNCVSENNCESFECPTTSTRCEITYCSEDTISEGEVCAVVESEESNETDSIIFSEEANETDI